MSKTNKYENIDLVKTDYDNFKNLAFFINQYKKAQEMIKEVEDFYQSFLQSKLLPTEEILKDEFVNFINLEKKYVTEWRSSKYGTYDIYVDLTVIDDIWQRTNTSKMERAFYELRHNISVYANSLKENPEFKNYFHSKEDYYMKDVIIHDEVIKHVNERFRDEIYAFISKYITTKKISINYYYFYNNIRVPIHFCDSESHMKKAKFVLNEKKNLMTITVQTVSECQKYVWPTNGPTLRTTETRQVSFDTNTNEYVSHDISSCTDEIKYKY